MIADSEIKYELEKLSNRLNEIRGSLDLDRKREQIIELEEKMNAPEFWNDQNSAQKVINETNQLKEQIDKIDELIEQYEDLNLMLELAVGESDEALLKETDIGTRNFRKNLLNFELQLLLSETYDKNNAIVEIHPGAGGTESQDWAQMLLRMYTRWAEEHGYKTEILDYLNGDEAGIKSVTLLIKGNNSYGYLKAEKGVHRLVRISPFDSSGRRHTSFSSVNVLPELDDDIDIEIKSDDLKIDTYRSGGAGGQHVNTTDSAVRITYMPTGTVVTCQSERSQIKNRESAMKLLKAKLYDLQKEEQEKEAAKVRGEQKEIAWGSQIRSYVFHPYSMVKDHRTNTEVGNVNSVMDGNIDSFIDAYLRSKIAK
ncbi:MAG: peptide chain release factor 2 [Vulcanibacillus sp.]